MADGKKIDAVFQANPNAGNDPSKKASVPVDFGRNTEEAYSLEQITNVVSVRLGFPENIPDPSAFSMRFPDNTLIAVVDPIDTDYEYFVINTTGTTPTGGGTQGALAVTAADYENSYPYYLHISDDDSTYAQVAPADTDPNNDGLDPPGLVLKAKYTLAPPAITDLVVTPQAAGSGQVVINFTAPTVVDGQKSIELFIVRTDDNTQLPTRTAISDGDTISNLPNGVELQFIIVVTANNGETSQSNLETKTIPADTASVYAGEIAIVQPDPRYEAASGETITITFERTGNVSTKAVSFDTRLIQNSTAIAGTTYTDWGASTTLTILAGNTQVTKTISIIGEEATTLSAQVEIIPGSVVPASGDSADIAVYPDNTALFYCTGTGTGSSDSLAISSTITDDGVSFTDGFLINAINYSSQSIGDAQDADEDLADALAADPYSTLPNVETNNDDYLVTRSRDFGYTVDPATSYMALAPRKDYKVNFGIGNTGTYYLYARAYVNKDYRANIWCGLDGSPNWSTGLSGVIKIGTAYNDDWRWEPVLDSSNDPISINVTTDGEHTLNIWKYKDQLALDRFCLVKDNSLDLSAHGVAGNSDGSPDAYGDAQNDYTAAADPIDNASNIGAPTRPVPPSDVIVPTVSPVLGATNVGLQIPITLTFETGASGIQVTSLVESDGTNNIQANTLLVNNVLTWTPTQNRAEDTTYTLTGSGIVIDNSGAEKTWSVSSSEVSFTTINTAASGVIITLNPSQWPADHDMTRDEVKAWIGTDGATDTMAHIDNGGVRNVIDPFGSGEKVWKIRFDEGFNGTLNSGIQLDASLNDLDEVYIMMDAAYCNRASDGVDFVFPASIHGPKLRCQTAIGPWGCSMQCTGSNLSIVEQWAAVGETYPYLDTYIDGICFDYEYTQQGDAKHRIPNTLDPTIYSNVDKQYQLAWRKGAYTQVELYAKMNTGNTNNAVIKMWIDGVLRLNRTGFRFIADDDPEYGKGFSGYNLRFWSGGPVGNAKYLHTQTQWVYVKNFIVSTDPITH